MKNKRLFIIIGLMLIMLGEVLWFSYVIRTRPAPAPIVIEKNNSRYEATVECEKIASQATNTDWQYNDCRANLYKTLEKGIGLETL